MNFLIDSVEEIDEYTKARIENPETKSQKEKQNLMMVMVVQENKRVMQIYVYIYRYIEREKVLGIVIV